MIVLLFKILLNFIFSFQNFFIPLFFLKLVHLNEMIAIP